MENLKEYLKKLGIAYSLAVLLFLIVSLIFTYTNINDSLINMFVYIVNIISVTIGSMLLLRKKKMKGILYGFLFGLIYFILLYLIAVIFYTGFFVNSSLLIYFLTICITGIVGGIIGVNI